MSYSRWRKDDPWYIFWSTNSGATIDTQILSCWYSKSESKDLTDFMYHELKDSRDECFKKTGATENDRQHFDYCVDEWMKDMEEEFEESGNTPTEEKG